MSTALVRSSKKRGKTSDPKISREDVKIVKKKSKRAAKKDTEIVPYMPGTVVHDILARFPAEVVHSYKLVSKEWLDIISRTDFIAHNFKFSRPQILLQHPTSRTRTYFNVKVMEFDEQDHVCKLSNLLGLPRTGRIRQNCYGLLLVDVPKQPGMLRVLNVATKKHVTLPRCPSYCPHKACAATLVFNHSTKEFKVVHMYTAGAGFEILTLGHPDNAWKRVPEPWKGSLARPFGLDFTWRDPVISENGTVLHWYVHSDRYILSMDISDEKPITTNLPDVGMEFNRWNYILLELDGCLAVVFHDMNAHIDIWVLKDFRAGVWYKRHFIKDDYVRFDDGKSGSGFLSLEKLIPVGGIGNGKDLVFKYDDTFYSVVYLCVYDMDAGVITKKFPMDPKMKNMEPLVHYRSSLYHWNTFKE